VWTVRGARGVLELAPGTLERSGTQVGDRLAFVATVVGPLS